MSLYTVDIHTMRSGASGGLQIPQQADLHIHSNQEILSDLRATYIRLEVFSAKLDAEEIQTAFEQANPNCTIKVKIDRHSSGRPLIQVLPLISQDVRRSFQQTGNRLLETQLATQFTTAQSIECITNHRVGLISNGSARAQRFQIIPELERDALLICKYTRLQPFPQWLSVSNQEDFIKASVALAGNFGLLRLSGLDRDLAIESVERIRDQVSIPVVHAEAEERALLYSANLINLCANLGIELKDKNIAILGIGAEAAGIFRLLEQRSITRFYGIDGDFRHLARFEKSGGIASSMDHVYETADIIIITPIFQATLEEHRFQPGQLILDYNDSILNREKLSPEVIDRAYTGEPPHLAHILPGILAGLQKRGAPIDPTEIIERLLPTLLTGNGRGLLPLPNNDLIQKQIEALK